MFPGIKFHFLQEYFYMHFFKSLFIAKKNNKKKQVFISVLKNINVFFFLHENMEVKTKIGKAWEADRNKIRKLRPNKISQDKKKSEKFIENPNILRRIKLQFT